eukprot:gene57028-biopygen110858
MLESVRLAGHAKVTMWVCSPSRLRQLGLNYRAYRLSHLGVIVPPRHNVRPGGCGPLWRFEQWGDGDGCGQGNQWWQGVWNAIMAVFVYVHAVCINFPAKQDGLWPAANTHILSKLL